MRVLNPLLKEKLQESLSAVAPITLIVLVLSVLLVPMDAGTVLLFLLGAVMLVLGMAFFQLGADMAMTPLIAVQIMGLQYRAKLNEIEKAAAANLAAMPDSDDIVDLGLIATNSGIAFTIPISGGSSVLIKMIESLGAQGGRGSMERDVIDMSVQNCSLIMAIVNQGYSEEVMNAARPAGARGGTVFPARRLVNEETMKFWGISIQPEKEIVLIVAQAPYKKAIMQAIGDACGFHSDAHGLVISLPVEDAIGLKAPEDDGASDAIDMK